MTLRLSTHAGSSPQVTVLDNGEPSLRSTSRVVVRIADVNDNPPVFSHKLFNVRLPERLNPGTSGPVYRLVASDLDEGLNGRVTYKAATPQTESSVKAAASQQHLPAGSLKRPPLPWASLLTASPRPPRPALPHHGFPSASVPLPVGPPRLCSRAGQGCLPRTPFANSKCWVEKKTN